MSVEHRIEIKREQGAGSREQGAGSIIKELVGFFNVIKNQQNCSETIYKCYIIFAINNLQKPKKIRLQLFNIMLIVNLSNLQVFS
ncbi:MAG: hypothetical protein F6K63_07625 [Moorea sp. SIO1G6]|uniref:hypothetical protein n=1 Tax=Moorena sp. SIO1G6 TaxID=2607840 RepID=UPI0013C010F3|nr:hypothetical protein [Moorena sp. SIO1G6]NET64263.1 hypothetical protein [Moorena sp. SIO1G6]